MNTPAVRFEKTVYLLQPLNPIHCMLITSRFRAAKVRLPARARLINEHPR